MSKLVCLQAGHENIGSNCWPALRGGTGAPGEQEFTVRIRNAVSTLLQSKGVAVQLVDANANCQGLSNKDYDLFLALHFDADTYGTGGGFVGAPDPSVDNSNAESKRIRDTITSVYFKETGISNHPERLNANVTFYYMWASLSSKTPCVLIECGVGQDAHDKILLANTALIAGGIAKGVCKALGVAYDPVTPPSEEMFLGKPKSYWLQTENDKATLARDNATLQTKEQNYLQTIQQFTLSNAQKDSQLSAYADKINTIKKLLA